MSSFSFSDITHQRLLDISDALTRKSSLLPQFHQNLVFSFPPHRKSPPATTFTLEESYPTRVNTGNFSLNPNAPPNADLLSYEEWLFESMKEVEALQEDQEAAAHLRSKALNAALEEALIDVERCKINEWERRRQSLLQQSDTTKDHEQKRPNKERSMRKVDTGQFTSHAILSRPPPLLISLLLCAVLHLLCGVSIAQTVFVMESLKTILADSSTRNEHHRRLNTGVPGDVRGVLKVLDLEPKTEAFVCCTECFSLYPIGEDNVFPAVCNYQQTSQSPPCGASLISTRRVKGREKSFPCRKFIRQDFHHWLGRLLCRPGMEELMDASVRNAGTNNLGILSDIWDAPVLRTIKLPDGRMFLEVEGGNGRYVFSICIDGLLPHGKGSGPSVSVGSIFFVCLNLPPHLRYRYENMYLAGVIPGPKHPSKDQINRILEVILEPFRESYQHGVFYTSTPSHPEGKDTVSIVVPLVADTLSAHQMNGNASFNHTHGCPFCELTSGDFEDLECDQWPRRVSEKSIKIAQSWLLSRTVEEQDAIYEAHGIRWSAMLTLPYWDPVSFLAIDLMHNLFLGLLAYFITNVWGMSSDEADGLDGISQDPQKNRPSRSELEAGLLSVRKDSLDVLKGLRLPVLREVARDLGVKRWKSKKGKLIKHLQEFRVKKGWFTESGVYIPSSQDIPLSDGHGKLSRALSDIKKRSRASIAKHSYTTLVDACSRLLGGSSADYSGHTKDNILDLLENYRKLQGIIGEDGILLRKKRAQKPIAGAQLNEDESYQQALSILRQGTKSELDKLRLPTLIRLCQEHLPESRDWKSLKKSDILALLYAYRTKEGISDASGKLLFVRTSSIMPHHETEAVRREELDHADELVESGSKSKLTSIRVPVLVALCAQKLKIKVANTRKAAMEALEDYRRANNIVDERGRVLPGRKKKSRNRVLGKTTLERVWVDMRNLQAPTSLTRAPPSIGTPGQGTISADEWRTFCTVNLVITLVAMWGLKDEGSRERALLTNFLDLVVSVESASARITTPKRRIEYASHLKRHLKTMLELFPGTTITSNQHKAMHVPQCLSFLGPSHVLWCYGFERGNHELQKINTNNKIHEVATTLFTRFCYKQNLRHIFSSCSLPAPLRSLADTFTKCFGIGTTGTLLSEMLAAEPTPLPGDMMATSSSTLSSTNKQYLERNELPSDVADAFRHELGIDHLSQVKRLSRFEEGGDLYQPHHVAPGNSLVTFSSNSPDGWRAGRIREIFEYTKVEGGVLTTTTYVAVDVYASVGSSIASIDPFRRERQGRLYRSIFTGSPKILTREDVLCPFVLVQTHIDGLPYGTEVGTRPDDYVVILPRMKW